MSFPVSNPAQLAAIVPYLIDFHPQDKHVITFGFGATQADEFTAHDLAPTNTEELAHFTTTATRTAELLNAYDAHPPQSPSRPTVNTAKPATTPPLPGFSLT